MGRIGPRPSTSASPSPTAPWSPPRSTRADELLPSLLAVSDVMGTGWYAAMAAEVSPG